jgi:hypothetical protein
VGLWINGWAGDNAGNIVGRQPNTLLIAATTTAPTRRRPRGLSPRGTKDLGDGVFVNFWCHVECLTPNSWYAYATKVTRPHYYVCEIELMEVAASDPLGGGGEPWGPGVHLFSVSVEDEDERGVVNFDNVSTTIATAVIDDKVARLDRSRLKLLEPLTREALREGRVGWP